MTARRGSFRFKVTRFARAPLGRGRGAATWRYQLIRWARIGSRVVAGAAVIFLTAAFGAQMLRVGAEDYRLHKQIDAAERRSNDLVASSVKLEREITLLHDPDYLVPLIHEQLGLVKPHEVFIIISPTPSPSGN